MAYNPTLYNPYGQPQPYSWSQPSQPVWTPQPTNGLVRVKGRQGADAYPMGPNSVSPVLLDEDCDVFYIKRTDASGVGTVNEFDFAPRVAQQEQTATYVTTEQFDALVRKVEDLAATVPLQESASTQPVKRTRKVADNAE